jgi:hypothetical protein
MPQSRSLQATTDGKHQLETQSQSAKPTKANLRDVSLQAPLSIHLYRNASTDRILDPFLDTNEFKLLSNAVLVQVKFYFKWTVI